MPYIFIILILFSIGCQAPSNTIEKNIQKDTSLSSFYFSLTPEQLSLAKIVTGKIELKSISYKINVNGVIDVPPQNAISINIPLGGFLKFTELLPGSIIKKGQIIAYVEDLQYIQIQQDYLMAKTKLNLLKKDFERQKALYENQANTEKTLQISENEFITQKILLKSLKEKLSLIYIDADTLTENNLSKTIKIPSPINGYVTKVNAHLGKYIQPTDVLFECIDPKDIHLNLKIFEKDLPLLYIHQNVVAFSNSNPDKKYYCSIILLSPQINEDGSADIHCHFKNYDSKLVPGMYMNAEIEITNQIKTVLPESAIVRYENKNYIFINYNKNQFKILPIEIGKHQNGFIEILTPNLEQNQIVIEGAYTLLMKLKNKSE